MIRIDHTSFEFTAPDEKFAHGLYADWDNFCHRCFELVVEEYLSAYDQEKVLYEIERLELDLGSLPEEDFYREYPRRLKEELLKALPAWSLQREDKTEESGNSRLDNLFYYLEHGYLKTEWADIDFSLSQELGWLLPRSVPEQYIVRIARLCLDKEHVLRRLLWQTDSTSVLLRIYTASLSEPTAGLYGKHRFLARLLEVKPGIPVRFIHEATNDASLWGMAELLDSVSVRQIMVTETEEHAEVDLPPYWHYLYEWLIRYYPYNGLAIFGGKAEFTRHLHHRLLTFIRKRNYSFYLSKAELTVSFLLEVFGPAYYIDVLNAIYHLQPRLADGSPAYDGYFNQELYRIFLQLSLLHLPAVTREESPSGKDKVPSGLKSALDFMDMLQDTGRNNADKRTFIRIIIREQPETLIQWLQSEAAQENKTGISDIAVLIDADTMNRLLAALSFATLQMVEQIKGCLLQQFSKGNDWLKGVSEAQLELILRQSVLLWIGKGYHRQADSVNRLLRLAYRELTGKEGNAIPDELISGAIIAIQNGIQSDKLTALFQDIKRSNADKRMFIRTIIKVQPEILIQWLQSEAAQDRITIVSTIAALTDADTINRLLATLSFAALQAVEQIRNYLLQQLSGRSDWLKDTTEARLELLLRQSVLLWIGKGYCRQADRATRLSASLPLQEIQLEQAIEQHGRWSIQRLQEILTEPAIVPEEMKRRILVRFLEQSSDNYAEAVWQLHEHGLSSYLSCLISQPVWDEMFRQSVIRLGGTENAALLFSLFDGLTAHEHALSSYRQGDTKSLKVRLLVWLAETIRLQETHKRPVSEYIRSLFADLFGSKDMPEVILTLWREMGHTDHPAAEEILHLLADNESRQTRLMKTDYEEWQRQAENDSNVIQMLFESRWNTVDGFIEWLDDVAVPYEIKSGLLQYAVTEQPTRWICLLRDLPHESQNIAAIAGYVPAPLMLQGMARTDFYQVSVLSQLMERLQQQEEELSRLAGSGLSLPLALSKALLLYLQDRNTSGRTLTAEEITEKFLAFFYFIHIGKTDYHDDALWMSFSDKVTSDMSGSEKDMTSDDINKILSDTSSSDMAFRQSVNFLIDRQPEKLLTWLEKDANQPEIERIALVSDRIMAERWIVCLSTTAGFEHAGVFQQLTSWLLGGIPDRISVAESIRVLLSWVKETDWKRQTPSEMETFFFSRLFGQSAIPLPLEKMADSDLPEDTRRRWLRNYMRFQPEELLEYIQKTVSQNMLPPDKWIAWLDTEDWLRLVASLSLSGAELFRQMLEYLSKMKTFQKNELRQVLATYIIKSPTDQWIYDSPEAIVRSWVQSLPEKKEAVKEELWLQLCETVQLSIDGRGGTDEAIETAEFLLVGNAGLCLLAAWFFRLFSMLNYLDDERKSLRNTALKIRAVFLLQYIVYGEEREYRETELVFNRLLVGLPQHIPFPKQLPLTSEEKQTVDSMVAGIKANWPSMDGTSVRGFRQSFIARSGTLEQQEERWLLTMEEKTHDILLESIPWSFRQIRLPWLKKYIQVVWHEKQKFQ